MNLNEVVNYLSTSSVTWDFTPTNIDASGSKGACSDVRRYLGSYGIAKQSVKLIVAKIDVNQNQVG